MSAILSYKPKPIYTSLVIHAILFGILLWLALQNPIQLDGLSDATIQLDSVNTQSPAKTKRGSRLKRSTPSTKDRSEGISLSDLGMRMRPLESHSEPERESNHYSTSTDDGINPNQVPEGNGDILTPDPRLARFNQYIYKTVQGWLDRDAYLNTERIYGTVQLKIWFSADGEYLEDETLFEFQDPNFKAIVARALRKSFATPIPRAYLVKKQKFFIERQVVIRQF